VIGAELLTQGMDDIVDPLGDRVMKNVPALVRIPLSREKLWHKSGKIIMQLV
jgi:hypothetical protein